MKKARLFLKKVREKVLFEAKRLWDSLEPVTPDNAPRLWTNEDEERDG